MKKKLMSLTFLCLSMSALSCLDVFPTKKVVLEDGRTILSNQDDLTLYTFDIDKNGESSCFDSCLVIWPAVYFEGNEEQLPENYSVHIRKDDGRKQLVRNGSPLYLYIGDKEKGDIHGDNINNVWHIIELD